MVHKTRHIVFLMAALLMVGCGTARQQVAVPEDPPVVRAEPVSEQDQLQSTALLIEGKRQKTLGNLERAIVSFDDAIAKDPNNDAAYFELSRVHATLQAFEDALRYANKAIGLDPDNKQYRLLLADIYVLQDDISRAIEVYEQLAIDHPENPDVQKTLVGAYLYDDRFDEAIRVLEYIETLIGFSKDVSIQKQKIWINRGEFEKAIQEAEQMVRMYPEEIMFYELLGDLYMETGRLDKARDIYREILVIEPDSHLARLLLADYYHERNQPDSAFVFLKEAFRSPDMEMEGKARIIFSYMQWSDEDPSLLDRALELTEILIEIHPDDAESYLIAGDLLIRDGQAEKARDRYLQGARMDPSSLSVWQQILSLDLQLGDFEGMREHSDEALQYFIEQPIIFLFNGLANMQLKDYQAAASSLEYGLVLAVADEDLQQDFLTMLGDTYYYLDAHEESDTYYEKALERNPSNATALNNYSYHLALRKERLDEALEMSEKSLRLQPDNAAFMDTFGWIHYQLGNYRKAEEWISRALEYSDPASAAILEHYGDVLYKLGEIEQALIYWEKALEAGNGSDFLHKKILDRTLYE